MASCTAAAAATAAATAAANSEQKPDSQQQPGCIAVAAVCSTKRVVQAPLTAAAAKQPSITLRVDAGLGTAALSHGQRGFGDQAALTHLQSQLHINALLSEW